jgi:MinD-like ATPase involved in chromosome partitioning or flagellar assembly
MARPAVILVGADKGGVGKTTVSRTLLDYFASRKVPTRAFDTECPRGTLNRFHPDITDVVDVTSVPDQMKIFDTIESSAAQITLIDVRAGLMLLTRRRPGAALHRVLAEPQGRQDPGGAPPHRAPPFRRPSGRRP